ncbi:MAG: pyrroline-5-carboxylate reductase family protein [Sphingopyxis sp.]
MLIGPDMATTTTTTTTNELAGFTRSILLYGCGTMAGAMLARWVACGLPASAVTALRKSGAQVDGAHATISTSQGQTPPDLLIIGIKPQLFPALSADIAGLIGPGTLVISMMAGITLDGLAAALPTASSIIRIMPNMPVATGRGVVAAIARGASAGQLADWAALCAPLGHAHSLTDEGEFDLVTALTGCGPAFVYRFIAAISGAAVRLGLDADSADQLARATVAGAAASAAESTTTPAAMATAVASPGGMTQAGLDVLDSDGRLATLMAETLRAARDRGRELGLAARKDG